MCETGNPGRRLPGERSTCDALLDVLAASCGCLPRGHDRDALRPAGHLIVYTNLLDGPIDAAETASIHEPLGNVVANLVESDLEDTFADAGFTIKIKHIIGTEWREYLEERDQVVSGELLRLARLRRSRDRVVDRYGEEAFRTAEASLQWGVHQFLGRFVPVIYVAGGTSSR